MEDDDNWLNLSRMRCGGCGSSLVRSDWSPFNDAHLLCCEACPRRVEVSYYDDRMDEIRLAGGYEAVMALIEPLLRPCDCGGRFLHDAPRRCPHCAAVVVGEAAAAVEVNPAWDDDDEASIERSEAITARLTRTEHIWTV